MTWVINMQCNSNFQVMNLKRKSSQVVLLLVLSLLLCWSSFLSLSLPGMCAVVLITTVEKVLAITKTCLPNLWKKILMTTRQLKCLMTRDLGKGLNLPEARVRSQFTAKYFLVCRYSCKYVRSYYSKGSHSMF